MRKVNCVIIDDEPPASDILRYYIDKTPNFEVADIYHDPIKALGGLRDEKVDVIFCDVEMPDINGLQLLESLSLTQNKNVLSSLFPLMLNMRWMVLTSMLSTIY